VALENAQIHEIGARCNGQWIFAMSGATSLYMMMVSILSDKGPHTQGGKPMVFCIVLEVLIALKDELRIKGCS
jgi:hypothetical protein